MTITFADGTHFDIAATAFDDFVKHDLKWVEFVHGRASVKKLACKKTLTSRFLPPEITIKMCISVLPAAAKAAF